MMVIGKTTKEMDKVFFIIMTVIVMKVIGKTAKKMEKVFIIIITEIVMKGIGKTIKGMDMVFILITESRFLKFSLMIQWFFRSCNITVTCVLWAKGKN